MRSECWGSSFNFATIERAEVYATAVSWLNALKGIRQRRVLSITPNRVVEPVYDLSVNGTPSFFANGFAVHNTRWAVYDLYEFIEQEDPSVEVYKRAGVEDGVSIWPEMFSLETHARLRKEFGTLYPLLYLNSATDPALTDFDLEQIRVFRVEGDKIAFDETEQDLLLHKEYSGPVKTPDLPRGTVVTRDMWGQLMGRGKEAYLRLKYG